MSGIDRIAAERKRQIEKEGWSAEHDDQHRLGQLAQAATCYAALAATQSRMTIFAKPIGCPTEWPWYRKWWNPSDNPVRNLEIAGALIAAEIDRLERAGG